MLDSFHPMPYSDFSDPRSTGAMARAIEAVATELGAHSPLVIGGEPVETRRKIESTNPAKPDQLVGTAASAGAAEVGAALEAARLAYPGWSSRTAEERAGVVHRVGDAMADRKYELAAWQCFEAGKNWAEAEADVAEAVDFCRYYAHQALEMAQPRETVELSGETNESWLQAIGAGAVIPPWNFPLAILVGMSMGPVAAGNTVVVKPASNAPLVGWGFLRILQEVGFPPGVVNYLPGAGSDIGDALVDDPRTRFINFTGSKEVGLRIAERAAVVHPGQRWMKRAYMEMGGKDGMIVDETADLDAAAADVVRSAFGFQGQKCSACSRLIAVDAIHDDLVDRVVQAAAALSIGPPIENHAMGPVISAIQHRAILAEIENGTAEATLVMGGRARNQDGGYYIEPTIFVDVAPDARLAQHEIFGPVLSVIRVPDFDTALEVANSTEYGLTGGVYSEDEQRISRAKRDFHVGNLYVNRKITGALVGVQPFGGFNMSGSNAKAGGPDYLRLFMEMKTMARRR